MKNQRWINFVLLAAVIALGAFAYLKPVKKAETFRLSTLRAADVNSIRIEQTGTPPATLDRTNSQWRITAPLAARADDFQMQRLLELLDATSVERFAATGLARFDLNEPGARVTFNQQVYAFGGINTVSRDQYVMTQDGVYMLSMRYGAALPKSAMQLVSKQLFGADEVPVGFELKDFRVVQNDGKWQFTPATADVSQDDLNRWVETWRLANAMTVQPLNDRRPVSTLQVHMKSGGALTISVLQREPTLVLARGDDPFAYEFSAGSARRLLAPPAANATE